MKVWWRAAITLLFVGGWVALRAQETTAEKTRIRSIGEIAKQNPVDPSLGRSITTVESGAHSTVTVWQFTKGIAPHYHREHDEVIYCEKGEGIAQIGAELRKMRAGDFVLIPQGVPHSVTVTKGLMRGISIFSPVFDGKDRVAVEPAEKR